MQDLERDGIAVLRSRELCDQLRDDPAAAMMRLLGQAPLHISCVEVAPIPGRRSIVESDRDGRLHVDAFPLVSPDVVVMSCYQHASAGGDSLFVDTWELLREIRCDDPGLYAQLFLHCRQFRFPAYSVFAPTFSLRQGRLMCHHATFPMPGDEIGLRFQERVDGARKITFRLAAGELYLINNHRFLHGRTCFSGARRLQRLQAWCEPALGAPPELLAAARRVLDWRLDVMPGGAEWVRKRLGLSPVPPADVARIPNSRQDDLLVGQLRALPPPPADLVNAMLSP